MFWDYVLPIKQKKIAPIEIYNETGQVVYRKEPRFSQGCIRENIELDHSVLPGVYILTFTVGNTTENTRMMLTIGVPYAMQVITPAWA